uniref:NOL1/NOP2/Sun domain family member 4 n=1 Tax=Parastrongyloides trichosuri TaxID=131310 RepID=A0A0N4Z2B4_PARTI
MSCILSRVRILQRKECLNIVLRQKSGKFKAKIAKTTQLKTPSMMALDHFDFYYGPMFGKNWPSVRLGLTTPNHFVAVVNRFSDECQINEEIIKDLGTVNLIEKLTKGMDTASERLKKKKEMTDKKPMMDVDNESGLSDIEERNNLENVEMRSEAGLTEFQQSGESFSVGDLHSGNKVKEMNDIKITGLEGQYVSLPVKDDFIYYPRNLKVYAYPRGVLSDYPAPWIDKKQVSGWWLLDGGSVVPVLALNIEKNDIILDMCAAPGGKSLLMLQTGLPAKVVCNDEKMSRLGQLRKALTMYIPEDSEYAEKIILKRKNASDINGWDELNLYDKVLVDVPCSTDRLAANQDEGNMFSKQMTNQRLNLPELQTKILINALRSAKIGGSVVYSTCTLSPLQNESVIENACAIVKRDYGIVYIEKSLNQLKEHLTSTGLYKFSEQCNRGTLVVPFLPSNFGPMYVCKLYRQK